MYEPYASIKEKGLYLIFDKEFERYDFDIANAALSLWGHTSGSYDGMHPSEALTLYYFLLFRLEEWYEGTSWSKPIDDAVFSLCFNVCKAYTDRTMNSDLENLDGYIYFPSTLREQTLVRAE